MSKDVKVTTGKELNEKETLEAFLKALRQKNCKYSDAIKFICKSQQIECELIGKRMVHAHLNGIWELVNSCKDVKLSIKISTNKLLKVFKLKFISVNNVKMECTVVKESGLRKPDIKGVWGVNVESFKLVKP